jgi:hypothetical protein
LHAFLEETKPSLILIEGLSDANNQIPHILHPATKLPIALLAFTKEIPIRTLLYPMAVYSPEYQALVWAKQHQVDASFIDLPSSVFLGIEDQILKNGTTWTPEGDQTNIYQSWAEAAGEADHDSYWERHFEHNLQYDSYRLAAFELGKSLRAITKDKPDYQAFNLIREAYMRERIRQAIEAGYKAEEIVVVCGAFHSSVLSLADDFLTEQELDQLPSLETKLTLMPYSYFRLSSQSGYGAGNPAPAYFEMMWNCFLEKKKDELAHHYLANIANQMRINGNFSSSAQVIEGVRLANGLASLHQGSMPSLTDLKDAAITCLAEGEHASISEAMARIEIGTKIGELPEGVSQTSIQENFYYELKRLKLDDYRSSVAKTLDLDLRENRRVKSEEAAFLDLSRSRFLHQLKNLGICFVRQAKASSSQAIWKEIWDLQWSPEAEIQLVELNLKGETLPIAIAFEFKYRLENNPDIESIALVIKEAGLCGMQESMEQARIALQEYSVESGSFEALANVAYDLHSTIQYGGLRKYNTSSLTPLLTQIFFRSCLLIIDAANCNQEAALGLVNAIDLINKISLEYDDLLDDDLWLEKLKELAERDDRNPKVSGFACCILMERNLLNNDDLAREVSRRLSPGIEPDLGAGWFEGLAMRNRYVLISRLELWLQLDEYLKSLTNDEFLRALIFLRRSFSTFSPQDKQSICENLGELWDINKDQVSEVLSERLNEEEKEKLDELNDFDFGDI